MNILIIDDTKSITSILQKYLSIKGHLVSVCNDGIDGLEKIQKYPWYCILFHIAIPEFSGYDILKNLEDSGDLGDKKIILYTASEISESVMKKLRQKYGIHSFLKKPCSLKKVVDAIAA